MTDSVTQKLLPIPHKEEFQKLCWEFFFLEKTLKQHNSFSNIYSNSSLLIWVGLTLLVQPLFKLLEKIEIDSFMLITYVLLGIFSIGWGIGMKRIEWPLLKRQQNIRYFFRDKGFWIDTGLSGNVVTLYDEKAQITHNPFKSESYG